MSYINQIVVDGTTYDIEAKAIDSTVDASLIHTSNLVNGFTQTTAGVNALDAAAGKTLNDSLAYCGGLIGTDKIINKTNTDLNTILTPGIYSVQNTNSGSYNYPSGTDGILIVMAWSESYIRQIFFQQGTPSTTDIYWYTRTISGSGSTFGSWNRFLNNNFLPKYYSKTNMSDVNVESGTTEVSLGSFTVPAGVTLIMATVAWASNATGRRYMSLGDSATTSWGYLAQSCTNAVNGSTTVQSVTFGRSFSTQTTAYIMGYQNSGSTLTAHIRYNYINFPVS